MQPADGSTSQGHMLCTCYRVHASDLGARVAALGTQLVDLSLCDVSPLFGLIQLMLQLAELAKMIISLFLLFEPN